MRIRSDLSAFTSTGCAPRSVLTETVLLKAGAMICGTSMSSARRSNAASAPLPEPVPAPISKSLFTRRAAAEPARVIRSACACVSSDRSLPMEISAAEPVIADKRLLKSWAIPDAIRPSCSCCSARASEACMAAARSSWSSLWVTSRRIRTFCSCPKGETRISCR